MPSTDQAIMNWGSVCRDAEQESLQDAREGDEGRVQGKNAREGTPATKCVFMQRLRGGRAIPGHS